MLGGTPWWLDKYLFSAKPQFKVLDPDDPVDVRVTAKLNRETLMCGYRAYAAMGSFYAGVAQRHLEAAQRCV